jgi:hypothetical protein
MGSNGGLLFSAFFCLPLACALRIAMLSAARMKN